MKRRNWRGGNWRRHRNPKSRCLISHTRHSAAPPLSQRPAGHTPKHGSGLLQGLLSRSSTAHASLATGQTVPDIHPSTSCPAPPRRPAAPHARKASAARDSRYIGGSVTAIHNKLHTLLKLLEFRIIGSAEGCRGTRLAWSRWTHSPRCIGR
jgi:hypothetical protein